jgi:hypothetical protein
MSDSVKVMIEVIDGKIRFNTDAPVSDTVYLLEMYKQKLMSDVLNIARNPPPQLSDEEKKEFKSAYTKAHIGNADYFKFKDQKVLTKYAKYLIESWK